MEPSRQQARSKSMFSLRSDLLERPFFFGRDILIPKCLRGQVVGHKSMQTLFIIQANMRSHPGDDFIVDFVGLGREFLCGKLKPTLTPNGIAKTPENQRAFEIDERS